MFWCRRLLVGLRRNPARVLPFLWLLIPVALGGYVGGRQLWARHHFRAAERCLQGRQFAEARAHLTRCLAVWPTDVKTHFLLARTARRAGDYQEAGQHLERCEQLHGATRDIALERLLARAQRGDLDPRAENLLWSYVKEDDPDSSLILEALVQGYFHAYRLGEAITCLQRWLRREPDNVQALVWRGQAWEGLQDLPRAIADYRAALERDPEHFDARLRLAQALINADQRLDEAVDHLNQLRQRQPRNAEVLRSLASCRSQRGQGAEARALLDEVLAEDPRDVAALRQRGKLAFEQGQAAAAQGWLRRALEVDAHDYETWFALGQSLQQAGKEKEARQCLSRSEQIRADFQHLRELAAKAGEKPTDPAPRYQAGMICLRNGQEQEALRWFNGALQVDPNYQPARKALAEYSRRQANPAAQPPALSPE